MPSSKRLLAYGCLVWASYLLARFFIQRLIPATGWDSYLRQDFYITFARLGAGLAVLWLARLRWSMETLGLSRLHLGSTKAWISVGLLLSASVFGILSHPASAGAGPGWNWRLSELVIALVVAANEELAFRGLFYRGMRESFGPTWAVWIPSLAFAGMHFGYQPLFHLPEIFLIGGTYALLRERGAALSTLILVHFVYDGFFAVAAPGPGFVLGPYLTSLVCCLLALIMAWISPTRRLRLPGMDLLFVYGTLKRRETAARTLNMEGRADYLGISAIQGRLYQVDGYPGMRLSKKFGEQVAGELYTLCDPGLLRELDKYEGEDYLRDKVELDEKNEAWVYLLKKLPRTAPKNHMQNQN
jgi:gamma-glutamylcyclotransferase (GGCT)/AIG2-like uncharacterized protein YtfP/membrane protease YdiL (CAAX protease family)